MLPRLNTAEVRYLQALGLLSGLCLFFVLSRWTLTSSPRFWFLIENLMLAALGLLFGWLLARQLKVIRWSSWQGISLTLLWLICLPNSWYVITDFVHVEPTAEISQLYDISMVGTLVICGFVFGFTSLYLVHRELLKRFSRHASLAVVLAVILLSSFAIYLGRDLRWNTWNIFTDPGGFILSITDRVIDPFGQPRMINVTGLLFILISSLYLAIWIVLRPSQAKRLS